MGQVTADLRRDARVLAECVAVVRFEGIEILGKIRDISCSGCFIETLSRYEIGTPMSLAFSLDPEPLAGAPSFRTDGRIARRAAQGMGVRFAYLDARAPCALRQWIEFRRTTQ